MPLTRRFSAHIFYTQTKHIITIMADNVTVTNRYLKYTNKDEVQHLLEEVENRSFFRDMTEEEYETLSKAEQENGDLYLLHESEE